MKKILIILTLISLLVACGDNQSSGANSSGNTQASKKAEKLLACSVFSEDYIKSTYLGSELVRMKEGGSSHPYCGASFKYSGSEYDVTLVLGLIGNANKETLELSVSHIKKSGKLQEVIGAGEKAYTSNAGAYQISALNNGNLIHIGVHKDNKFDLEVTKKIANDMFEILD